MDNTTPPRSFSKAVFSSSVNDTSPTSRTNHEHRHPSQLKPLSLPILPGRPGLVESPLSRWADTPLSSAISPGNPYPRFGMQSQFDNRSPGDTADYSDRSPLPYIRRSGSSSLMSLNDDASSVTSRSRESYDQRVSPEHDGDFHMEETGFRRLHIDDYSNRPEGYSPGATVGQKRRASSPPGEDGPSLHTVGSASDLYRRRESASRASPTPRFHSTSGSVSSTASAPRNNSYASSLSVTASSITSMSSYGRLSPGGISPGGFSTTGSDMSDSPYVTSLSLNPSPRGSVSRTNHSRALSETRPLMTSRKLSEGLGTSKHSSPPKMQGVFMCECCPKKPKKFDSQDELKYFLPLYILVCFLIVDLAHTNKKSNTNVHIAAIVSRTKTKQNGIKILSTFDAILGPAQHFRAMQQHFTIPQIGRTRLTRAAIAVRISRALESHPRLYPDHQSLSQQTRTGRLG